MKKTEAQRVPLKRNVNDVERILILRHVTLKNKKNTPLFSNHVKAKRWFIYNEHSTAF